jgi:hypothetical protein
MSALLTRLSAKYESFEHFLDFVAGKKALERKEGEKVVTSLLEKIDIAALKHGAKLIVVISPGKEDFPRKSKEFIWFEDSFCKNNKYNSIDFYKIISEHHKDLGQVYLDEAHFSKYGNEILAETLFRKIEDIERNH